MTVYLYFYSSFISPINGAALRYASTAVEDENWSGKYPFFFPGQGAQNVGMANKICDEVPKAKQLFDEASDILGYDLLKKCKEGPKDELDSTVREILNTSARSSGLVN